MTEVALPDNNQVAELLLEGQVRRAMDSMFAMGRDPNMQLVVMTPEYRVAMINQVETYLMDYVGRVPGALDEAGVELHWEPPTIIFDEDEQRYHVITYSAHQWPLIEHLVNTRAWSQ
jgi:hypothetical protein